MIENDEQLQTTWQSLGIAYQSLAELRLRVLPKNPQTYEVSAQPAWHQIAKLRADIDAYLGLDQAEPLDGSTSPFRLSSKTTSSYRAPTKHSSICIGLWQRYAKIYPLIPAITPSMLRETSTRSSSLRRRLIAILG